jgi:hypothetical protein
VSYKDVGSGSHERSLDLRVWFHCAACKPFINYVYEILTPSIYQLLEYRD